MVKFILIGTVDGPKRVTQGALITIGAGLGQDFLLKMARFPTRLFFVAYPCTGHGQKAI